MARFLLFTLAAPLASFGDVAPGERRVSRGYPGRSMLLGLIGAALGLRRDDARHAALAQSLSFAVRIDHASSLLADYHTAQVAPQKIRKKAQLRTRKAEIEAAGDDIETILSLREYRTDGAFTVAVVAEEGAPFTLEQMGQALAFPRFILSVGRRACPLGLPPAPHVVEADDLAGAIAIYDRTEAEGMRGTLRRVMKAGSNSTLWDISADASLVVQGLVPKDGRLVQTRDEPVNRLRWQFTLRPEYRLQMAAKGVV